MNASEALESNHPSPVGPKQGGETGILDHAEFSEKKNSKNSAFANATRRGCAFDTFEEFSVKLSQIFHRAILRAGSVRTDTSPGRSVVGINLGRFFKHLDRHEKVVLPMEVDTSEIEFMG
jgi:hypothetical protein